MSLDRIIDNLFTVIIQPLILLLFAVAVVLFLFGVLKTLVKGGSSEARETGRKHITWGIVGMVIMVSAWAIVRILENTLR
ncbi:MAG: hypothetical protein WDZ70_02175 [Candidatus Paceibacterota bacterium]